MELRQEMTVQVRQNEYGVYLADGEGNLIPGVQALSMHVDLIEAPTITVELNVFEVETIEGKATWLGLEDVPTEALIQELQRRGATVEVVQAP